MSIELASRVREGRAIYVVVLLLLMHLTLISFQIEDPSGMLLIRKWILVASAPFLNVSSTVSGAVSGFWKNYVWLYGARRENEQLQERVRQLSLLNGSLEQVREENTRLRRLLELKSSTSFQSLYSVGARVVGRVPSYLANTLYLDRGSADGVKVDSAVVSAGGIVGRIVVTSEHNSQMQLITNADASVGVILERTRSPGVLRGSGNSLLDLYYIGNNEQVELGDVVRTSGLDGIFPKGLPVGKVVLSEKGKSVYRIIQVAPSADLVRIEEVLILTGSNMAEGNEDAVSPARTNDRGAP